MVLFSPLGLMNYLAFGWVQDWFLEHVCALIGRLNFVLEEFT